MRWLIMLRGINVGRANRLGMAELRAALSAPDAAIGGHRLIDVRTYLQSGSVVADWAGVDGQQLEPGVREVIARRLERALGVVARRADEIAAVITDNPFREQAANAPRLLQVTFLTGSLGNADLSRLRSLCGAGELLAAGNRVLYSWHPNGVSRSKLGLALSTPAPGVAGTSRNWRTVVACDEMLSA